QQSRGLGEHHKTQVRIVQAPKPPYPFRARKLGFEGEVELAITIGKDGFVKTGNIIRSSGRNDCDSSALDTVLSKWRFSPATFSGIPIESKEQVVVRFQLR
ncbi:MAG: energy transducer TonB, partial [Bdellovibrionales bacterium]|nr:energy transducer TonB [Bdellovibrionales bacterium]